MSDELGGQWAILELMGHRRLAGFLSEQEIAGAKFIRIEVAGPAGDVEATQFYAPGAVYAITPTTEETVRRAAGINRPAPVQRWELGAVADAIVSDDEDDDDETGYLEPGYDKP